MTTLTDDGRAILTMSEMRQAIRLIQKWQGMDFDPHSVVHIALNRFTVSPQDRSVLVDRGRDLVRLMPELGADKPSAEDLEFSGEYPDEWLVAVALGERS